jgi:hypothetical protein
VAGTVKERLFNAMAPWPTSEFWLRLKYLDERHTMAEQTVAAAAPEGDGTSTQKHDSHLCLTAELEKDAEAEKDGTSTPTFDTLEGIPTQTPDSPGCLMCSG